MKKAETENNLNKVNKMKGIKLMDKKTQKKAFSVKPTIYAACVELTNSPVAAGLLCQMYVRTFKKNTLNDENGNAGWLVLTAVQWRVTTGFTRHQHNDAVSLLKKKGILEQRRRKLKYNDPAAVAWYRVSAHAMSAIADIMSRTGISAFSEQGENTISMISEETPVVSSADADVLKEMSISKNEKVEKNVYVVKTETIGGESILVEKSQGKKKHKSIKTKGDKEWFDNTMSFVLEGTSYTPEPYSYMHCKSLQDIIKYLDDNLTGFNPVLEGASNRSISALKYVSQNWNNFSAFSAFHFHTYNETASPQIWCLKNQAKAIPDYIKFLCFFRKIQDEANAKGLKVPKDSEQIQVMDKHFLYLKSSDEQKEKIIFTFIGHKKTGGHMTADEKFDIYIKKQASKK